MENNNQKRKPVNVKRLALNAVLVALYYVLGFWRIPIGNVLRVSVAPFAVILCALAFGPADGLIVGLLGEFLTQILGPYGLTPTTLLWCLGEVVRGLSLGGASRLILKKGIDTGAKKVALVLAACVVTGILCSLCNTFVLYVDSKMFGYYSYAMVFGALLTRLALSIVTSGLLGYLALPVISALRRAKMI